MGGDFNSFLEACRLELEVAKGPEFCTGAVEDGLLTAECSEIWKQLPGEIRETFSQATIEPDPASGASSKAKRAGPAAAKPHQSGPCEFHCESLGIRLDVSRPKSTVTITSTSTTTNISAKNAGKKNGPKAGNAKATPETGPEKAIGPKTRGRPKKVAAGVTVEAEIGVVEAGHEGQPVAKGSATDTATSKHLSATNNLLADEGQSQRPARSSRRNASSSSRSPAPEKAVESAETLTRAGKAEDKGDKADSGSCGNKATTKGRAKAPKKSKVSSDKEEPKGGKDPIQMDATYLVSP